MIKSSDRVAGESDMIKGMFESMVKQHLGIGIPTIRKERRLKYADEIIAKLDTVILTTCEEVTDIRKRALAGEFDLQMKSDE